MKAKRSRKPVAEASKPLAEKAHTSKKIKVSKVPKFAREGLQKTEPRLKNPIAQAAARAARARLRRGNAMALD